ncbi:DUF2330 domain-containing protein [Nocardia sp. NPDC051030]|uniref:DUF2330 domain-containing protein n=1 Tax=Nocardia sp. NPDC051030 TaxID=3155162 RepID=UPI00343EEF6A
MLLRRTARLIAVVAIVLGAGGISLATPAFACACGGVAIPDGGTPVQVDGETALVGWDGTTETILMRLALRSGGDRAALIVPTLTPATVTAGKSDTFTELTRLTAPEVVIDRRVESGGGDRAGAAAPTEAPTVLARVELGPLEATTLTGGDVTGIQRWLSDNGYVMRPEVIATLQPYLSEGWSFVAMRLTATALSGELDPVRVSFASDRLVYPMRMSSAATRTQSVHLYVLAEHRVRRSDADAAAQTVTVDFAGRVSGSSDPDLRQLSASGRDYLTELTVLISTPAAIAHDFTFTNAPDDSGYRRVVHRTETVRGFDSDGDSVVKIVVLSVMSVISILVVVWLLRRLSRRARP